jgi:5-methylcytosine-specific restriction endonuclease McrA
MEPANELDRVRSLSDDAVLLGLTRSLRASRRAVAEIVAHLGEVEERRLHLLGGYSSMFDYCVRCLGMSEDEAYRRIEVARLVRTYPRLLPMLRGGQVSLSVASLLKARLTRANHEALLADLTGKTVAQAREVLAAWFPQPDVMPLLRKLPTRAVPTAATVRSSARTAANEAQVPDIARPPNPASVNEQIPSAVPTAGTPEAQSTKPVTSAQQTLPRQASPAPALASPSRSLEPLSPDRYKLQLTVTSDLKRKLDLARDLLRHAVPSGDLPTILERALDLLLEQTTQRRFAQKRKPAPPTNERTMPQPVAVTTAPIKPPAPAPAKPSRHIPNETRRAVLGRDGLRCTWQGPDGTRCNSQAWLEHDHIIPRGKGGTHDPLNGRLLCRPHNRLSAEQAYGRETITRIITRRRRARPPTSSAAEPSTT